MTDLNNLVGNIKKIHIINKSNERVIDAMIVDYTYNPDLAIHRQHKLDYVTTDGVIGNIFVNDNTSYTDITVSEHVKKYLTLIKESMLRKKKAQEILQEEASNIQVLTIDLLKEDDALSKEEFINELTSKLAQKYIDYSYTSISHGKTSLVYKLNSDINIMVTIKKHFISDIRINICKDTGKLVDSLDFISIGKGRWLNTKNEDKYNEFIKDYISLDYNNSDFINLTNSNDLCVSSRNYLSMDNETGGTYFKSLDVIKSNDKDNIILLNNDTINMILNLSELIKKN